MNRAPIDEEAPKDPGAHETHQSFSEKDFEGMKQCFNKVQELQYIVSMASATNVA